MKPATVPTKDALTGPDTTRKFFNRLTAINTAALAANPTTTECEMRLTKKLETRETPGELQHADHRRETEHWLEIRRTAGFGKRADRRKVHQRQRSHRP